MVELPNGPCAAFRGNDGSCRPDLLVGWVVPDVFGPKKVCDPSILRRDPFEETPPADKLRPLEQKTKLFAK